MEKILINTDEFNGCYVAIKSFDDNTIVGVGIILKKRCGKRK